MDIDSVPFEYIDRVLSVIEQTPQHIYLILTKRPLRMQRYFCEYRKDYHPLSNVLLGVTAENQEEADRRIPELMKLAARGWHTWVSYEPALSAVDLWGARYALPGGGVGSAFNWGAGISWVVCGSESGPNARPFDLDWARQVRDACVAAGVPFYFKQSPSVTGKLIHAPVLDGRQWLQLPWQEVPSE